MVDGAVRPYPYGRSPMKKRLLVGLLALTALVWNTPLSYAGLLHRCCGKCCGCKYSMQLCIRPYNAFSPICCGSICGDCCCPFPCGGGGPIMPSCFAQGPCDMCCDSCVGGACSGPVHAAPPAGGSGGSGGPGGPG